MRLATGLMACAVLFAVTGAAMGNIGWAGDIWPVNGTGYTSADDIEVYVQVWKDGYTNYPYAAPGIEAQLWYRCSSGGDFYGMSMPYFNDVGSNDQFRGVIPHTAHECSEIEFYVKVIDHEDGEVLYPQDQNGNDPNFFLPIVPATAQDCLVTFTVCISEGSTGGVCVTGSDPALTGWSVPGVAMTQPCPETSPNLYTAEVLIPAGSNPDVQYKFQKDDCLVWDCDPNHIFTIYDGYSAIILPTYGWCGATPDCPDCGTPVEESTWGMVKALYR